MNTDEDNDALEDFPGDADAITDDDEDNLLNEINLNADNCRLCKAKEAHHAVLVRSFASLFKNKLTNMEASHLHTEYLTTKLDDVAKTVNLDVSTILAEQIRDPVLGTVRSRLRKGILPEAKSPETQKSKGSLRYCHEVDQLSIEEEGQLFCYNGPTDKLDDENLRVCLPLSVFLPCFKLGH